MIADEPPPSPVERRLDEHLELLRSSPPRTGTALAPRVVRTARWQRALRAPLRVGGMIAAALVDGIVGLFASRRSRS
jgi:hypothetical protein